MHPFRCNCQRLFHAFKRIWTQDFLWALFAECLATFLLIVVGLGFAINLGQESPNPRVIISMCFGVSIGILTYFSGPVSGGHINPAVTVAMVASRKLNPLNATFYILAQCLGAVAGAGVLYIILPATQRVNLGATMINPDLHPANGLLVEILITFLLVLTIFVSCDPKRAHKRDYASFAIGTSVGIGHLFAIPYTGASMNPARTLGPAVITLNFNDYWVYWLGPILGGFLAAALYNFLPDFETMQIEPELDDNEISMSWCNCGPMRAFKNMWTRAYVWTLFSEYLGTLFVVFMGLGCSINWTAVDDNLLIAMGFGLSLTILAHCFEPISGAHFNPAVTVAVVVMRKLSPAKALFYILAQCLGAVTGAAILYSMTPDAQRGSLGATMINSDFHVAYGFLLEMIITFLLVLTFLATCDPRQTHLRGSFSFTIGIVALICQYFVIPYTGASMNPARSFGPALLTLNFKDHWVYWVGPIPGGIVAAILYRLFFNSVEMAVVEDIPLEGVISWNHRLSPEQPSSGTGDGDQSSEHHSSQTDNLPSTSYTPNSSPAFFLTTPSYPSPITTPLPSNSSPNTTPLPSNSSPTTTPLPSYSSPNTTPLPSYSSPITTPLPSYPSPTTTPLPSNSSPTTNPLPSYSSPNTSPLPSYPSPNTSPLPSYPSPNTTPLPSYPSPNTSPLPSYSSPITTPLPSYSSPNTTPLPSYSSPNTTSLPSNSTSTTFPFDDSFFVNINLSEE